MHLVHTMLIEIGSVDSLNRSIYVNHSQEAANILPKRTLEEDRWTQLTQLFNLMTHTKLSWLLDSVTISCCLFCDFQHVQKSW